ncbi:MAG TPA: pyridoxamine 5'-phosphate oxidase family protein [Bacteroidales bacterium]|nr:pyridoxamine 5'-phosphate oxidase family protein [Bacteroidales bacterium]
MRVKTLQYPEQKEDIIKRCQVCNVAMTDENQNPYVLPFNFAYADGALYLHSAPEGRKIDILTKNPRVCVSFSTDYELYHQNENVACSYSMRYRSVLVYGEVEFIDLLDEKKRILNKIMAHYTGKEEFNYNLPALKNVKIFKVNISQMDGRTFGY